MKNWNKNLVHGFPYSSFALLLNNGERGLWLKLVRSQLFQLRDDFQSQQALILQGLSPLPAPSLAELKAQHGGEAVLFATSGSTGKLKWVAHTRASLRASARAVNAHLGVCEGERWLLALPTYHVGGFGILVRSWEAGGEVVEFSERWNAQRFAEQVEQLQVQWTSLVPTQVHDLVRENLQASPSLRGVIVGGGRLRPELAAAARELAWPILASYGLSEAGSQVATEVPGEEEQGLQLLPGWEVQPNPKGALLRGHALAQGYWAEEDLGAWQFQALGDEAGWFQSADLLEVEELSEGRQRLQMLGRLDDRVKILGELVSLAGLQSQLEALLKEGEDAALRVRADARAESCLHLEFCAMEDDRARQLQAEFEASTPAYVKIAHRQAVENIARSALGKLLGEK